MEAIDNSPDWKCDMEAMDVEWEGRDGPVRKSNGQLLNSDIFEGKPTWIIDELIENRSIEAKILRGGLRID